METKQSGIDRNEARFSALRCHALHGAFHSATETRTAESEAKDSTRLLIGCKLSRN
jgi:hypothetical protein